MHRALVRNFQHPRPLLGGKVSGDVDISTHPVHAIVLLVIHLDFERGQLDPLVPSIQRQRERGAGRQCSVEQLMGVGPEIIASDVATGVGDHHVRSDLDLLGNRPDARPSSPHRS